MKSETGLNYLQVTFYKWWTFEDIWYEEQNSKPWIPLRMGRRRYESESLTLTGDP